MYIFLVEKSVRSNFFLICKSIYILKVYSIRYTNEINHKMSTTTTKKTNKKIPVEKINDTRMQSFFFRETQLIAVLLLIFI